MLKEPAWWSQDEHAVMAIERPLGLILRYVNKLAGEQSQYWSLVGFSHLGVILVIVVRGTLLKHLQEGTIIMLNIGNKYSFV